MIPESMIINILMAHHDEIIHARVEKTLKDINENFSCEREYTNT